MVKLWTDAFKGAAMSEVQSIAKENTDTESSGVRYSIEEDADGNKYVEVDEDIFANSDGETIAKTIARVIKDKFNNLIDIHGQKFKINKTTNDEWRRSERATILMKKSPSVYFDKLRTIANADELLEAANNWIGEALKHERKDKIVEFARGNINFKVGDNGYSADVIVGISSDGSAVLYDLIDIREKNITEAQVTKAEKNRLRRQDTSVTDEIVPQTPGIVNPDSKNSLPETDSKGKFSLPESDTASYDILARDNVRLQNQVKHLENEMKLTEGHKMRPEAVSKLARKLKKDYYSTLSAEEIAAELTKIFEYIANTENASGDIAGKAMYSLAKNIINKTTPFHQTKTATKTVLKLF